MPVQVTIDSRGIVEENVSSGEGLKVNTPLQGVSPGKIGSSDNSSPLSGAFTITSPGHYWVSGSTTTTGTMPSPLEMPGAMVLLCNTVAGGAFMLTGSTPAGVTNPFVANGAGGGSVPTTVNGTVDAGTKLTVPAGGSIGLQSSGLHWIPMIASGSFTLA